MATEKDTPTTENIEETPVETAEASEATEVEAKEVVIEKGKYVAAIGRRKTATAQVRISAASSMEVIVNDKDVSDFFPSEYYVKSLMDPFTKNKLPRKFKVSVLVKGGGIRSQAEAIRHGVARALVAANGELRQDLKKQGFLKRDPRKKERKKPGLKKARKSAQWSKR